jgi:hypothetical protein
VEEVMEYYLCPVCCEVHPASGHICRWTSIEKKKETPRQEETRPAYYHPDGIEVWDFIVSNNIPFLEGNIVKYVCRWRQKNGLPDLIKARTYLNKLIEEEEKKG